MDSVTAKGLCMSIDFQQVRQQIVAMGASAAARQRALDEKRERALQLLQEYASRPEDLRAQVEQVVRYHDPSLRCALPIDEALGRSEAINASFTLPTLPTSATILAADGSQINPDRNEQVSYGLVNVGAIQMQLGAAQAPRTTLESRLLDEEQLYRTGGVISEAALALQRDLSERQMLVSLASQASPPVISFTDGPMELWGAKDAGDPAEFQRSLEAYLEVLDQLCQMGVITAGYVDKPAANLVVRLLEVASTPESDLPRIRDIHPLQGVLDSELFGQLLQPGQRSAVFAIQSQSAASYREQKALHFFYLNVSFNEEPFLARVEIPAWVAASPASLNALHAVLVSQCRLMGARPFPYLLHRAHETAVVRLEEKEQVTQMIVQELVRRGVRVGRLSNKQSAKNLKTRTRYK